MVNIGDYLAAGSTKTLLVGIHYRDDVDPDDLPTSNESLTISSGLVYKQLGKKSYGYSSNVLNRGESIPNTATIYDNYQSVVNETGNAFFIRYLISENRILDWDVGFINNSNVYYMKGKTPSYSEKMTILNDIYGSSNCMEESTRINTYYFCNGTDTSFKSFIDGDIIVSGNGNECYDGSYLYYGEARE